MYLISCNRAKKGLKTHDMKRGPRKVQDAFHFSWEMKTIIEMEKNF